MYTIIERSGVGSDVKILWLAANSDPSKFSEEGMREHAKIVDALREAGVPYSYPDPIMAYDGVDLSFATIISGPLGTASISALAGVAGAFLHARFGRKIRIKIGDIEAEASSIAEVEQLLEKALEVYDRHQSADEE